MKHIRSGITKSRSAWNSRTARGVRELHAKLHISVGAKELGLVHTDGRGKESAADGRGSQRESKPLCGAGERNFSKKNQVYQRGLESADSRVEFSEEE